MSQGTMRGMSEQLDPPFWSFDVLTARHDEMKGGGPYLERRSRVAVCRSAYPSYGMAAEVAACMAVIRHGGMPVAILPRY